MLKAFQNFLAQDESQDGMVAGGYGEFGYDVTNLIPVNGVKGDVKNSTYWV
jgi:hypothetical protein